MPSCGGITTMSFTRASAVLGATAPWSGSGTRTATATTPGGVGSPDTIAPTPTRAAAVADRRCRKDHLISPAAPVLLPGLKEARNVSKDSGHRSESRHDAGARGAAGESAPALASL